jgi:hypothetical protein
MFLSSDGYSYYQEIPFSYVIRIFVTILVKTKYMRVQFRAVYIHLSSRHILINPVSLTSMNLSKTFFFYKTGLPASAKPILEGPVLYQN